MFVFVIVIVFVFVFVFVFVIIFQQDGARAWLVGFASLATEHFMATVYSRLVATNNGHQPDSVEIKLGIR